jgi:hypothetical protein
VTDRDVLDRRGVRRVRDAFFVDASVTTYQTVLPALVPR